MKVLRLLALFGIAILLLSSLLLGFSKGPLPQLSGGFQEKTCLACHNSFALDRGRTRGGIFHLTGAPKIYRAGAVYPITVRIGQPGQSQWGFQLSARFADSGRQAGRLVSIDQLTQIKEKEKIQYIGHTSMGSRGGTVKGPVEFVFNWIAPDPSAGDVLFNAAGNASDASGDPSGDYIYRAGAYSGSAVEPTAPPQRAEVRPEVPSSDFSNRLINLPTTRPIHRGLFEYFIAHRFTFPIFREGSPSLAFGLDSSANVVFGFHYGLAEDIAVSFSRSKFDRIMDFGGEYRPLQQGEGIPVSLLARVGVAGKDNFGMTPDAFRPSTQRYHYSTYLQLSTSHSFADRFSLYAVPSVILNSRDEALLTSGRPGFGKEHNHTLSVGLGGSLKLAPSAFLLGEYIPRVWGFRGVNKDRPAVSVGFQKNTFGHSFALVLSTATGLAPNEYSVEATDTFRIAFNIFRRMR